MLQEKVQHTHFPFIAGLITFNYAPPLAWIFYPLSLLPYLTSLQLFRLVGALSFLGSYFIFYKRLITTTKPIDIAVLFISSVLYYPFYHAYMEGQVSFFLLLGIVLTWYFLKKNRSFWIGISLLIFWLKPQLLLFPMLLFLWKKQWYVLLGFIIGSIVLWCIAYIIFTPQGIHNFNRESEVLFHAGMAYALSPFQQPTMLGVIKNISGEAHTTKVMTPYIISVIACFILFVWVWKGTWKPQSKRFDIQWSVLLVLMMVSSFHAHYQDLSLLIFPLLVIIQHIRRWEVLAKFVVLFLFALLWAFSIVYIAVFCMIVYLIILSRMLLNDSYRN